MENLLFLLATSFVLRIASPRKAGLQAIGDTGCSIQFTNADFEKTLTSSGEDLFFNEYISSRITYGAICIRMKQRYSLEQAAGMLGEYINKLRGPFYIFHSVGHEAAADWNHAGSASLVDYWQDAVGVDCKVKGYTDGQFLAVLYVKNIGEADVTKVDAFLDSFHFPTPIFSQG